MPGAINSSFPQPLLLVPKPISVIKTPATNPDTNGNNQVSTGKVPTTAEMNASTPSQTKSPGSINLKA